MDEYWKDVSLLIVEDDRVYRERLARALGERGLVVKVAEDGDRAVEMASEESPEWALVDLRMPGTKTGLDVVRALKSLEPSTRVVVLTGFGSIATAMEAVKLGATHYLTKPATVEEILQAFVKGFEGAPHESVENVPSLARVEWEHIQRVLAECEGNISKAARLLGIHRRSLQRKLGKYPLPR